MHCPKCGVPMSATDQFCASCGNPIPRGFFTNPAGAAGMQVPQPYSGVPETSGKAVGSLVCGIINIFPLSVVAIILGHISLSEIKKSAGRLQGRGLAIAGLVLGYLGVAFIPFILIVAAIAIPNLLRAKIAANEAAAMGSVRTLVTAETSYSAMNPTKGYTCSLPDLASAGLITGPLASGEKTGYRFELQNCTSETDGGPATKFQITAVPLKFNATGVRAFCADESAVLRVSHGSAETCLANSVPLE